MDAAAVLLERAVRICDSWDLPTLLRRAIEQAQQGGGICEEACRAAWLGEAYLLASRTEDAARLARGAFDRATTGGEGQHLSAGHLTVDRVSERAGCVGALIAHRIPLTRHAAAPYCSGIQLASARR